MENPIKINKLRILLRNRKSIIFVIISGILLFMITFFVANYYMTYKKTLVKKENFDTVKPREMSARVYFNPSKEDIFKYLKEGKFDRMYSLYLLELNKKYAIPFSPLFFTFFVLALSILRKYSKIALLVISVFSCFLYWILLFLCQTISIRYIGKFGFLLIWLPNILFLLITIIIYKIKKGSHPYEFK
jgi:lipopolysaccharide export LptBFGC system permease protein LptF